MDTNMSEPDGRYSQQEIDHLARIAKGGAGLILTGATMVERKISPVNPNVPYIDASYHIPMAGELVEAVHDYGAKVGMQLSLGPGKNSSQVSPERIPIAPSPLPALMYPGLLCHGLMVEEIKEIVRACGDAAQRAAMAGFDMIELHCHRGSLVDEFMSSIWNKRNDEYGGDFEGRMRFAIELINAIRAKVGPNFPLSFRYSVDHGFKGGRNLADSQEIARHLEAAGVDILHLDAGCPESSSPSLLTTYGPDGCWIDYAAAIKQVINIPVITVGSIRYPELAEQILGEGKADFIALGRALLADPDWPNKAREGRVEDIRPCIKCEHCHSCIGAMHVITCSVNPTLLRERYYAITRAERPKKVMIIGGGPAGMEAAQVAALRGHKVTLYEKENELGGQLRPASKAPFKTPVGDLLNYLSIQLGKSGVKVKTGEEVTTHLFDVMKPEVVVVATGATPLIPSVTGIENEKIITAIDLHLGKKKVGNEVIVVGAAIVGCEAALCLAQEGKKVTIFKIRPGTEVAPDLNPISRKVILEELRKKGVTFIFDHTIKEFTAEGLVVTDKEGKQKSLKANTVVLALGAKSENKLVDELKDKIGQLYVIGDCVSPRGIREAMHEGFVAGWRI
jgi:2,4-dienoyl-CoA reductase-like NADH-dependent reductase (Old Yellow Enzyme family)/thioredoxin reductase